MSTNHKTLPLAFLPIDSIVEQPIQYLISQGQCVTHYEYHALSDFGLGPPVIRYHVQNDQLAQTFIAKWHEPNEGPCVFALLRSLWTMAFSVSPYRIPEPLVYVADQNILLQAEACGTALVHFLDAAVRAFVPVRLAARWLAKLHALQNLQASCANFRVLSPAAIMATMQTHRDALCAHRPADAVRLSSISDTISRILMTHTMPPCVPTHGDYHPKNIYIDADGITVIDFDRFALCHAERDIAYFMAQSMTMAHIQTQSFARVRAWNTVFLHEYQRVGLTCDAHLLSAYLGLAFLEILFYRLCVRPVADQSFVPNWLDECERYLQSPSA